MRETHLIGVNAVNANFSEVFLY
ncbi:MAG: hypothetical protein ACE5E7_02895 [Anaerolineae bacterium]